jgi:hypothetical protein
MTQNFKGDSTELKMQDAGRPPFDSATASKDQFFDRCYTAADFLLMLYDAGRMPFSARVPRDAFVSFIRQAIPNFKFTGTFESYLFILNSIFGTAVEVLFTIPAAGRLQIEVNAGGATVDFNWIAKRFVDGGFVLDNMVTSDGDQLILASIVGIETEGQLQALFDELIPAGVQTEITLNFFQLSQWITKGLDQDYTMVARNLDEIVFYEP